MSNTYDDSFGRFPHRRPSVGRGAFTLLEVLIVVGIIALLATILLTAISRARDSGRRVQCLNNLQALARAVIAYTADNEGAFPFAAAKAATNSPIAPGHQYGDWVYWQSIPNPATPGTLVIDQLNAGGIGKNISGMDDRSIGGMATLRCPSDARLVNQGLLDFAPGQTSPSTPYPPAAYPFSYSLNALMSSANSDFANLAVPSGAVAHSMRAVKDAATKILIYEEDGRTIDDGNGVLIPNDDKTNMLSLRHDGLDELTNDPIRTKDPIKATVGPGNPPTLIITHGGKMGNVAFCDGSAASISRMDAHMAAHWAPDPALFPAYP